MSNNKTDVIWDTFNDHLMDNMKHLLSSLQFADVTLVCKDNVHVKAHSFVLSACSSVFSKLFNGEPQSNSKVSVEGIHHIDLYQILEFMYNGKIKVSEVRMNSFIAASKCLEVREICSEFENQKEESLLFGDNQEIETDLLASYITNHIPKQQIPIIYQTAQKCGEENCSEEFNTTVALTNHMKHVHQKIKYFCTECDYQGNRKLDIKLHRESKHEFIRYACTECEKHYTTQIQLKRHYESIHEHEGKKIYECDQCDFKTARGFYIKQHVKLIHEGEKTYKCDQCDFKTVHRSYIIQHNNIHEGVRFPCNDCDKKFSSPSGVRKHRQDVHRKRKTYKCDKCDFKTVDRSYIYEHNNRHKGVRFPCNECDKIFCFPSGVRKHKRDVHGKKTFNKSS